MKKLKTLLLTDCWAGPTYLLFFVYAVLAILTFRDYGITWDESWQSTYGNYIIQWYTSLFHIRNAVDYWNLYYYGGLFDTIAQLATRISPIGIFETRHLVNVLFGLLGLIGAFRLGKYLGGPLAGFLSVMFLALTPLYYGHSFNNPKDIPFAALFVIAFDYLVRAINLFPRVARELVVKLGIAIGLAMGVRVGGVLLLAYEGIAFCLWTMRAQVWGFHSREWADRIRSALFPFGIRYASTGIISYLAMLVWWPYAQTQPILNPLRALRLTTQFMFDIPVFFEGKMTPSSQLPWYYISKSFLIALPEFMLLGLAVALVFSVVAIYQIVLCRRANEFSIEYLVLAIGALSPIGYAAIARANVYDGARQFLFVIPLLAVIAALGVAKLVQQPLNKYMSLSVAATVTVSMIITIVDMAQLHPYEYIFFNRIFAGGLSQAAQSFETDYWGASYKEGAEWIAGHYKVNSGGDKPKVASCSFPLSTEYYLPGDLFEYLGSYEDQVSGHPDLFIATTRWGCDRKLDGRIVHIVERQGTPLLYVKEIPNTN